MISRLKTLAIGLVLGIAATAALAPSALANGRFPTSTNIQFFPGDDQRMLLPATFGLLISQDGGQSFHWICEDAIGYGGTYDPDYAISATGWIYSTTFDGLRRSEDGGCSFELLPLQDPQDPAETWNNKWVSSVEVASDGKVWAATSTGGEPNAVFYSTDGTEFVGAGLYDERAWWTSLLTSPSDPDHVYVTGFVIGRDDVPSRATLFSTEDGGASWQERLAAGIEFGAQPNTRLLGVAPGDPNVVYIRSAFAADGSGDIVYRSDDGGQSFVEVTRFDGAVDAFVAQSDGSVVVGSTAPCQDDIDPMSIKGCVKISPSGNAGTFEIAAERPAMNCVGERPSDGALFACGNNFGEDNFMVGQSTDKGQSWEPLAVFNDIDGPLECDPGTIQQDTCQENWRLTCLAISKCKENIDAGPGEPAATEDGSGCLGCGQQYPASPWWFAAMAVGAFCVSRRARG